MLNKLVEQAIEKLSAGRNHNARRYHPDFMVETANAVFMVEIMAEKHIDDAEKKYCEVVPAFNPANKGKKWTYVLIPHAAIVANISLKGLCK